MQKFFGRRFIIFVLGFIVCSTLHTQSLEKSATEKGMPPNSYPIHGSDLLWKQELEVRKFVAQHPEALQSNTLHKTAWTFTVGSTKSWYADNLITGSTSDRYQVPSTCRAVGTNCYIFVEDSSWNTRVNQAAVDSVRIYFDSKTPANPSRGIFVTDTSAFGNPPDVDFDPKIIILLLNIKDGYSGSGGFVAGYFNPFNEVSPSQHGYSTSNFAEMFYIDTNPLNVLTSGGLTTGISTLAHEFQHMIHFHYDPTEMTFINEGCSVLAEVHCGFPIYSQSYYASEPNHYLLDWRSGDLTKVLNDYSRAARFFVYLRDQAGIGVFKKIVASTLHGTAGIDAGLQAFGSTLRFNDILQDWFIANILDDRSVNSLYGYSYPNLPKPVEQTFFNPNIALTTDTVQNYAVEYLAFVAGSQLHATFTSSNSALIIKAVEIGSSTRVLDVTKNVEFTEPLFGTTYSEIHFVVMDTDPNTQAIYSYTASGIAVPVTNVERTSHALPTSLMLQQNYPNPFNPSTTIKFQMPSKGFVTLKIYDMIGREVTTLVDGFQEAGPHDVKFDASDLPSGVYLYRITSGTYRETKKLILMK